MRAIRVLAVLLAVALALGAFYFFSNGNGGGQGIDPEVPVPEPEEPVKTEGIVEGELPEGYAYDELTHTIHAPEPTSWHVRDELHSYYEANSGWSFTDRYRGYDVRNAESLTLETGSYLVSVGDADLRVVVPGTIERNVEWQYDTGDGVVTASISYSIPLSDLLEEDGYADALNDSLPRYPQFSSLPDLVRTGSVTDSIEASLSEEYVRIGGSHDDEQSYLDFVASFVQKCVKYPGKVGQRQWDFGLYGEDEYWAVPLQTLYYLCGDCEDNSALLCALYTEAGYDVAMGGKYGHVFVGVALRSGFEPVSQEFLQRLGVGYLGLVTGTAVDGGDTIYYAVETIRQQTPVGYMTEVNFESNTLWGMTGFYPVARS